MAAGYITVVAGPGQLAYLAFFERADCGKNPKLVKNVGKYRAGPGWARQLLMIETNHRLHYQLSPPLLLHFYFICRVVIKIPGRSPVTH